MPTTLVVRESKHYNVVDVKIPITQQAILSISKGILKDRLDTLFFSVFSRDAYSIHSVDHVFLSIDHRNVSITFKEAVNAQETSEVFIVLLTFTHSELEDPLYFSLDAVNTSSRGNTYLAMPFNLEPPEESQDRPPSARLTIDNIDRQLVEIIRSITTPVTVKFEVVLASNPSSVEAVWEGFQLRNITYDAFTIQGELTLESFLQEPYPSGVFCPAWFPGLFTVAPLFFMGIISYVL